MGRALLCMAVMVVGLGYFPASKFLSFDIGQEPLYMLCGLRRLW